ncbi:MAG TPA: hypothetical protein VE197_13640, partial [Mycobacterium sp.]|nr:hypothetical protein [Mycobacterium sp.]
GSGRTWECPSAFADEGDCWTWVATSGWFGALRASGFSGVGPGLLIGKIPKVSEQDEGTRRSLAPG